MKRILRNSMAALLALVLCITVMATCVSAADSGKVAEIRVSAVMRASSADALPASDTVYAVITPLDGAPAPTLTRMAIRCKGADKGGTASFFIPLTKIGEYHYDVTFEPGKNKTADYHEDALPVYHVTVLAVNNADGTGFDMSVVAHKGTSGAKTDIRYEIDYFSALQLNVVKKWVDQTSRRPLSVRVDLVCDNEVMPGMSLLLTEANGWQGFWAGLDPNHEYRALERKVTGYTATYKFDPAANVWYITNTGSMLQTGDMNWPIPVLCISGIALIAMGMMLLRRRREDFHA